MLVCIEMYVDNSVIVGCGLVGFRVIKELETYPEYVGCVDGWADRWMHVALQ
jgi:hypothetical protein